MTTTRLLALIAVCAPLSIAHAAARREQKTEAAVLAADDDWLTAERLGNVSALDARLADEYREVDPDGKVYPKSVLLASTARRPARATGSPASVAAEFRKQHPLIEKVVIIGDTAILSFHSVDPATTNLVLSVDVFAYEHGMWRGVLSKQSNQPKGG